MLTKENLKALAKLAGVDSETLEQAIKAEDEKAVEIVEPFKVFKTKEDFDKLENNFEEEARQSYLQGKDAGREIFIKEYKNKLDLNFEGKDPEKFVEALQTKAVEEAGKNPDKRVKELEEDLSKLRKTEEQKEARIKELEQEKEGIVVTSKIKSSLPENLIEGLDREDALVILKNNLTFTKDENGKPIVKKGEQVLKNDLREPLSYEDAINNFVEEKGWTKKPDGRGGNSGNPSGNPDTGYKSIRKMSELSEYFEEKGISPRGSEAKEITREVMAAADKAKEEFIFDDE